MHDDFLFQNQVRKRIANQAYSYLIHVTHLVLNILPAPLRNLGFRIMLHRVGKYVFFDYNVYIKFPWLVEMGDHISINRGAQFYPGFQGKNRVLLGNDVYIAPNVAFFAAGHDVVDLSKHVGGDIVIGDHVWLGAGTVVLPGVHIGANSIIGAGSIVTKNVPPNSVAVGNPARVIKTRKME